ncbi:MAG: hypothetical protein ACXVLM_20070, partial [Ilumatobacteraceae bacterium]
HVRRTLAGLIFGLAYVCASLAISGWLLQRSAFDPSRTGDLSAIVLQDARIKTQISDTIADAVSSQRGLDKESVRKTVSAVAGTREGAALLGKVLHDAHARLIGQLKGPVRITGAQMVLVVRNQIVADMPSITLPVPRVTALDRIRRILRWMVPFCALFAVGFFVIGFMLHPNRSALMHSLGYGMVLLAVLIAVLGYIVPRFVVPALSDSIWADVPARLANDSMPLLVGLAILCGGGGMMLLVGSGLLRRRRRWNAPVSTYRYREERRWGS